MRRTHADGAAAAAAGNMEDHWNNKYDVTDNDEGKRFRTKFLSTLLITNILISIFCARGRWFLYSIFSYNYETVQESHDSEFIIKIHRKRTFDLYWNNVER